METTTTKENTLLKQLEKLTAENHQLRERLTKRPIFYEIGSFYLRAESVDLIDASGIGDVHGNHSCKINGRPMALPISGSTLVSALGDVVRLSEKIETAVPLPDPTIPRSLFRRRG